MTSPVIEKFGKQIPTKKVFTDNLNSLMDIPTYQDLVRQWGYTLMKFQFDVLRDCLSINADGKLYYKKIGLSTGRQVGKTFIIELIIFIHIIFFKNDVLYTAHRDDTAQGIYERMMDRIIASYWLKKYFPGIEKQASIENPKKYKLQAFNPKTGERLGFVEFKTRGGRGLARGKSIKVVIFDEAQELSNDQDAAVSPVISTFENGQIYYFGTPSEIELVGQAELSKKSFFPQFRNKILTLEPPFILWNEWGLTNLGKVRDVEAWYECVPSLNFQLNKDQKFTINNLMASASTMDELEFAMEYLGYWPSQLKQAAMDLSKWNSLRIEPKDYSMNGDNPKIAVSFKFTEGSLIIAQAVTVAGQPVLVDIIARIDTTLPWEAKVEQYVLKYHKARSCISIIVDGRDVESFIQILVKNKLWSLNGNRYKQRKVTIASSKDMSAGTVLLINSVIEKSLCHFGQPAVDLAVEDAGKRSSNFNTVQGFMSMSGKVDVYYLEAEALAIMALLKNPKVDKDIDISHDENFMSGNLTKVSFGANRKRLGLSL